MAHDHAHDSEAAGPSADRRLVAAIVMNFALTVLEVVAGMFAGSLALAADGVHNFNDCLSLAVALVARRIGRWPSDQWRTFGYRRAETIGALVNLTALTMIGVYLAYEAVRRLFQPHPIEGWVVVGVAVVALVINLATAAVLHATSRANMNLRAAFLHNVGDALSSAGVVLSGAAVLLLKLYWVDALVTLAIAVYIFWQSLRMIARSVHLLLEGVPADIVLDRLIADLRTIDGIVDVHHVHVWEMDETHRALEAHIVVQAGDIASWSRIKAAVKSVLAERYHVHHSTLELETPDEAACAECPPTTAHHSLPATHD